MNSSMDVLAYGMECNGSICSDTGMIPRASDRVMRADWEEHYEHSRN
ncbi:hypothetical protein HNQ77_002393 [Silvibacterium bohemicum]|uniref:Uncharacterized protein n=1 Tax=Silvibacterium bohemicum TaxID=1577686 RepID=A0A841JZQ0_9BACT|nr:hypothetical protein [Silvibacterium bohemicum]